MRKFCTSNLVLHQFVYGLILGAALLLSAACRQPDSPSDGPGTSTPPGMGMVRVTFADGAARTIYPDKVFDHYVYTFTKVGESTGEVKTPDANGVFTLKIGNWNLAVQAYAAASSNSLAATGSTAAAFQVSLNTLTDNITVILSPAANTGAGTLSYTLKYPDASTLQTLAFVQVGGSLSVDLQTGVSPSTAGGVATLAGTKTEVSAGYYLITVILKDGAAKIAGKSEAVHIYDNLTTTVDLTFAADDFTAPDFNAATPTITSQPVGASYNRYTPAAALAVGASVNDGGNLSFQWYSNGTDSTSGGTAILGATGASYTPSTAAVGTVYYYVVVTNTNSYVNGNTTAAATSAVVAVTVNIISITEANLDQMKSLVADAASAGGGTSSAAPIVVKITIANASLLSGTDSRGTDPLHKLFDAIPSGKYVAYDMSGCTTFTSIGSVTDTIISARTNRAYLASIVLPDTLTSIGDMAFYNCSGLISVTIGNRVASIGIGAFHACSGLTLVTIPNSVTSIGHNAFSDCANLSVIQVGTSNIAYTAIEGVLFNKSGTTLVQYPAGKAGTIYTIPNSVTSIGDAAFSGCRGLDSVTIPDNVTFIGDYAFNACISLTSVTIPDNVTSIGHDAFNTCSSLTSVIIPNNVTSIGDYAFFSCTKLTWVYVLRDTTPLTTLDVTLGGYAFDATKASLVIYVLASKVDAYKGMSGWSKYESKIEAMYNTP